jgi:hypothetical protein
MNIVLGTLIVVVASAVTISAMLLVRRRAPEGSRFRDGDRASGVFGVLATGFALLLGFMIFLAFESTTSRPVDGPDRPAGASAPRPSPRSTRNHATIPQPHRRGHRRSRAGCHSAL